MAIFYLNLDQLYVHIYIFKFYDFCHVGPASSNEVQAEPMSTDPPQTTVHPPQNMMGASPVS